MRVDPSLVETNMVRVQFAALGIEWPEMKARLDGGRDQGQPPARRRLADRHPPRCRCRGRGPSALDPAVTGEGRAESDTGECRNPVPGSGKPDRGHGGRPLRCEGRPARRPAPTRFSGSRLRSLCLEGPEEELTRTQHAQPALFALSYALWETAWPKRTDLTPGGAAGHSLGEYTALAAAGVFDFDTALGLVALRGRAMARAADRETLRHGGV